LEKRLINPRGEIGKQMNPTEAIVGTRVKALFNFAGVPRNTKGVIDEDYGTGVMVAWNLKDRPLPEGYTCFDGKPACITGILRDGFDKNTELHLLEKIAG